MWLPSIGLACLCILFGVFAYQLPLPPWIFPAMGGVVPLSEPGMRHPRQPSPGGLCAGLLMYLVSTTRKARSCDTYIGGEIMDEVVRHKGTGTSWKT